MRKATNDGSRKASSDGAHTTPAQDAPARGAASRLASKSAVWVAASVGAALVVCFGIALQFWGTPPWRGAFAASSPAATFVGSEGCAGCHRAEAELWRSSQHKLAMDHATETSVLGDFADASFDHYGVRSRFFRRQGKFFVETDGPDGKL